MADVRFERVRKIFSKVTAVDDVELEIGDGEFMVLLGPSGCGKTTLLRCLAGLEKVDGGRVWIGGRDATNLPPRRRRIAMVFQSYAVFPHMKVYDNVGFGLKMQKAQGEDRRARAVGREPAPHRGHARPLPVAAIGRPAAARLPSPAPTKADVLLMDEPLSNLDALLRMEMRAELKALLRQLDATTIYVTHDQVEALSMGDRIAVMNSGRIVQVDSPLAVYDRPADTFVGGFIGTPPMNFVAAEVVANGASASARLSGGTLPLGEDARARSRRPSCSASGRSRSRSRPAGRRRDPRHGGRRRAARLAQPADRAHGGRHAEGVDAAGSVPRPDSDVWLRITRADPMDERRDRRGARRPRGVGACRKHRRAGGLTRRAVGERMVTIRAPGDVALVECETPAPGAGRCSCARSTPASRPGPS